VRERDRAVHLRELVEDRRGVLDVELDPAGKQRRELVLVADDDQSSGPREHDVVHPVPQGCAGRDHLEGSEESGFLASVKFG
jgi:hypothetical protein